MPELENKVVLVTGATRGIGEGIAQVLAREGARVVVSSIEGERAHELAANLPGAPARHMGLLLDVTNANERAAAVAKVVSHYGRLDGLVNNAGINFVKPFEQTTMADWRKVMAFDLDSVFDLCQHAIGQFLRQPKPGGSIVNISTVHTLATIAGSSVYAAAKGAVNMFSKGLATEFSHRNVRVNCVAPGLVKTEIWKQIVEEFGGDEEACLAYWRKNIPLADIITPQDIGEVVSFVLSDRARAMSGAVLYVDGGMTSQLIANR